MKHNNKPLFIVLSVIIFIFIGLVIVLPRLSKTKETSTTVDVSNYNISSVIAPDENNGNIGDHIKGDSSAPLTIYEYADYQCTGCATVNPWMKELLSEYSGKLRIVYRNFPLTSIHPNAIAAASAVEAAGLQGYWEEYGDLLFKNQAEWYYANGTNRANLFMQYFTTLTKGEGDLSKFRSDMGSSEVKKKVDFDKAIAESLKIDTTPSFFGEDGKEIDWISETDQSKTSVQNFFRNYINSELEKKGIK